jgi:hypothetical protein
MRDTEAAQGDLVDASRNIATLASIKFRARELELKGLNLRQEEGEEIRFTLNDYLGRGSRRPRHAPTNWPRRMPRCVHEVASLLGIEPCHDARRIH